MSERRRFVFELPPLPPAHEIVRSILRGEMNRAKTGADAATLAKRCLEHLQPYERDAIVLDVFARRAAEELAEKPPVDEREPSKSIYAIAAGLPGKGRRRP